MTEGCNNPYIPVAPPHLPPRPYRYEVNGIGFVYLLDANGRKIATLLGNAEQRVALAQFIVDAPHATDSATSCAVCGASVGHKADCPQSATFNDDCYVGGP